SEAAPSDNSIRLFFSMISSCSGLHRSIRQYRDCARIPADFNHVAPAPFGSVAARPKLVAAVERQLHGNELAKINALANACLQASGLCADGLRAKQRGGLCARSQAARRASFERPRKARNIERRPPIGQRAHSAFEKIRFAEEACDERVRRLLVDVRAGTELHDAAGP